MKKLYMPTIKGSSGRVLIILFKLYGFKAGLMGTYLN